MTYLVYAAIVGLALIVALILQAQGVPGAAWVALVAVVLLGALRFFWRGSDV